MEILPILAALRRHRSSALLIVLEIALTCAIVCNALFLISERVSRIGRPSGIAENELIRIHITGVGKRENSQATTREDLAVLEAIPGVRSAASTRMVPFGGSSWNSGVLRTPDQLHKDIVASVYYGSEGLLDTLGVQLIAGRDFTSDEYVDEKDAMAAAASDSPASCPVIITSAVSERLWPGQRGLGQNLYMGGITMRVVGILERLVRPNELSGASNFELSVVVPIRARHKPEDNYLLRVEPERRSEVLAAAVMALEQARSGRIILKQQTMEALRSDYYRTDRAMAWLLATVCGALLVITALGVVGLASFWVQQRTRQIGIRRAIGATRGQVVRHFLTENFLLATFGIALGMLLAYGVNQLLMERYELARLPAAYLPIGAAALWLLGQLAVLGPALRAASVPPAVATRTV